MPTAVLSPANGIETYINSTAGVTATTNNGALATVLVGQNGSGATLRGLIKFDLSSIPEDAEIVSATLSLYCSSQLSSNDYNVAIHRSLVQWFEGSGTATPPGAGQDGSTWNLRNANGSVAWAGGAGGASGSDWFATPTATTLITTTGQYFDWDVTADVVGWFEGTYTNHGWWLLGEAVVSSQKTFRTSDDVDNPDRWPILTVEYLVLETDMVGVSDGSATVVGTLHADGTMMGVSVNAATVTGNLITNAIVGSASGAATVTGDLKATSTLEVAIVGTSVVSGLLRGDGRLVGLITAGAQATGFGGFEGQLRGVSSGTSTAVALGLSLARHVVAARGCFADPLLYITDGSLKPSGQLNLTNLLSNKVGYTLNENGWRPAIAQYKEGGTWSDSPHATGRRLTKRVFGNVIEVFDLKLVGYSQDSAIDFQKELWNWQEAAADFGASDWYSTPVYLVAKGPYESSPRYALIYMMSIPELENPYAQPFFGIKNAVMEHLTLRLERGDWTHTPPSEYECVAISSVRSWTVAGWTTGS